MNHEARKSEIFNAVWRACDTFRGTIDPAEYKNYILTMLFVKYVSDLWKLKRSALEKKYDGDAARIERVLERERFKVVEESTFDYLYAHRDAANIGELINIGLEKLEEHNKSKLENVFRGVDFNSEPALGPTKDRNRRLKNLLNDFASKEATFTEEDLQADVVGDVYEFLIGAFAAGAGKKAGEFYTPPQVSTLLAKLVDPKPGDRISDPACGSGSLLIKVGREVGGRNFALYGQESNGSTWALAKMNMFLHEMDSARVEWGDTLNNPKLIEDDNLSHFNIVVANPPFSFDKWGADEAESDKHNRFWRGVPPKSRGDYAFITHMVETALKDEGKVGVIVPHGVLFRGGSEGVIRQKFIEDNLLEAVIGLPAQLFFGTGIPAAILVFNRGRKPWSEAITERDKYILFIDASRDYEDGKRQNRLRDQDIEKIVSTFREFNEVEKYSHRATLDEIKEAEFNLNIPRYVDTFEEEEEIDVAEVQREIDQIEDELADAKKKLQGYLKELGLDGGTGKRA